MWGKIAAESISVLNRLIEISVVIIITTGGREITRLGVLFTFSIEKCLHLLRGVRIVVFFYYFHQGYSYFFKKVLRDFNRFLLSFGILQKWREKSS